MAHILLIHNATSGKGRSKEELIPLLESVGHQCHYVQDIDVYLNDTFKEVDFMAIAGGDGTMKESLLSLLKRKGPYRSLPLAFLPTGTANNFASSLGIRGSLEEMVASWKTSTVQKIDIGSIASEIDAPFFIESVGFGIFPAFLEKMKKVPPSNPEESVRNSLSGFLETTAQAKPQSCRLFIDGTDYSGAYLLIEVMNTCSIGPNLLLSPQGDPGDGYLDVVLVKERERQILLSYAQHKLDGKEGTFSLPSIKAKKVSVSWSLNEMHVDDVLHPLLGSPLLEITILNGAFHYLKPR